MGPVDVSNILSMASKANLGTSKAIDQLFTSKEESSGSKKAPIKIKLGEGAKLDTTKLKQLAQERSAAMPTKERMHL